MGRELCDQCWNMKHNHCLTVVNAAGKPCECLCQQLEREQRLKREKAAAARKARKPSETGDMDGWNLRASAISG
jgi:hypothetical protein